MVLTLMVYIELMQHHGPPSWSTSSRPATTTGARRKTPSTRRGGDFFLEIKIPFTYDAMNLQRRTPLRGVDHVEDVGSIFVFEFAQAREDIIYVSGGRANEQHGLVFHRATDDFHKLRWV